MTACRPTALAFVPPVDEIDAWNDRSCGLATVHAITRPDTGELAGPLLLSSAGHGADSDLMMAYCLGRAHWGVGLASDRRVGPVGPCDRGPRRRLCAGTDADDIASQWALEKAGSTRDPGKTAPERVGSFRVCGG